MILADLDVAISAVCPIKGIARFKASEKIDELGKVWPRSAFGICKSGQIVRIDHVDGTTDDQRIAAMHVVEAAELD